MRFLLLLFGAVLSFGVEKKEASGLINTLLILINMLFKDFYRESRDGDSELKNLSTAIWKENALRRPAKFQKLFFNFFECKTIAQKENYETRRD